MKTSVPECRSARQPRRTGKWIGIAGRVRRVTVVATVLAASASAFALAPLGAGTASAKCYAVGNGGWTQWTGVARETPRTNTCDGDWIYKLSFLDLNWGDGVSTVFQVRRSDSFSGESWHNAYTLSEGGSTGNPVNLTITDNDDTNNMQFRICKTSGACAEHGTNIGH